MKTRVFFLVLAFAAGIINAEAQYNSLLWKIKGKEFDKPSYLYGTIHIKDKRAFQLGNSVMPAFNSCTSFAGEIVLDNSSQSGLMGMVLMGGDTTLDMLLSKEDYRMVKEYADRKLGMMASIIDRVKPLFTSSMITELDMKQDNAVTLDEYFQKLAAEKNMKVKGIETVEEQISALDKIPLRQQAKMLVSGIKEEKNDSRLVENMIKMYTNQNLDSLAALVNEYDTTESFNNVLILERNKVMAQRIAVLANSEAIFIGVGAAHLPGRNGVIELLRLQGFEVTPVYSQGTSQAPKLSEDKHIRTDTSWYEYKEGEGFYVKMPGKPMIKYDTLKTASDRIVTATYLDSSSAQLFIVNSFQAPGRSLERHKGQYFDDLISKLTKDKNSKVVYKKKIETPSGEAMEAEVKMMLGQVLRIRVYTSNNKAVQLMTGGSKKVVESERAEKFFDSFTFIK